tara:strand:+ start:141 stop:350 length:210 start_codon:yes stop_codon:yes gene_type:complete
MKITKEILKQIIKEECEAVLNEFKMPDTDFQIDVEPEEPEDQAPAPFVYKPDKAAAQQFLLQQFQKPQR